MSRKRKKRKKTANVSPGRKVAESPNEKTGSRAPEPIHLLLNRALQYQQAGQHDKAEALYNEVLESVPGHPDALHLLGLIRHQAGDMAGAIGLIDRALESAPGNAVFLYNKAVALGEMGRKGEAADCYRKVLEIRPDYPEAHYNLGNYLKDQGRTDEAAVCYRKAVQAKPDYIRAYMNLGSLAHMRHMPEEAMGYYQEALRIQPDSPEVYCKIGLMLRTLSRPDDALAHYEKALGIKPDFAVAHNNMGTVFQDRRDLDRAIACYRKAVEIDPNYNTAFLNLGNALFICGELGEAVTAYEKTLALKPDYAEAHVNMGLAQKKLGAPEKAIAHYQAAIQADPEYGQAYSCLVYQWQQICAWEELAEMAPKLDAVTRRRLENGEDPVETPFDNLTRCPDPALNFALGRSLSRNIRKNVSGLNSNFSFADRRSSDGKITIGYFSHDFYNHPVAHLILGLFGRHDREQFRVYCYSYGKDDGTHYRERISRDCDRFSDVRDLSHTEIARRIYDDGVDILVELMGHTLNSRPEVCALRPAPVQVSFLGYPGTTGADFIDYIITDRIVSPESHAPHYSEQLVHMPHCYQVNDSKQAISDKAFKRSDFGLPESGVVFCSFNQSYKIDLVMFDVWMRILKRVPGSVLWLLRVNRMAEENLKQAAQGRGIAPERLIFADKLPKDEHLARQCLADLALDTRIVNGHTTTSDALWSGVPVVTLRGAHFASRVAASILTAIGLPELITLTPEAYEHLAVDLGTNLGKLKALKRKLWENRLTQPLFDTDRFVRNLERAYAEMWDIFRADEKPRRIEIVEKGEGESLALPPAAVPSPLSDDAPESSDIGELLRRAARFSEEKKFDEAVRHYQSAIRLNPADELALCGLGKVFEAMGQLESAVRCYQNILPLNPSSGEAHRLLVDALHKMGKAEHARCYYRRAVRLGNQQYCIWIVSPPGYVHSHAFDEIALGVKSGLAKLGFDSPIVRDVKDIQGRTIVLGSGSIPKMGFKTLPADMIIFNLEQIYDGSPWLTQAYVHLLKSYPVWDYSKSNIRALNALGVNNVTYCGIGYESDLTKIADAEEQDIDVLFYGSLNKRRIKILEALKANGLKVVNLFGVYGDERDQYIARSKIVLNIHFYESKVFEIVRISYLLANRKFVVSEIGCDGELEKAFTEGIVFSTYENLVETCLKYLEDQDARKEIAEKGFHLIQQYPQSEFLKQALGMA